jgi:glutamate synthase (NADPH/NADH)
VIDCTVPVGCGPQGMIDALFNICEEAAEQVLGVHGNKGVQAIILSDKMSSPDRMPIPSLLTVGAVHQHLLKSMQRPKAALFLECGDAREVHDFATLLGFGADGVCPYLAYECFAKMNAEGVIYARSNQEFKTEELFYQYRKAVAKGVLKVMSKMGISTLQSYKGAQVFEALGLDDEVMDRCFTGTSSRIKGADFSAIYEDMSLLHLEAFPQHTNTVPLLRNPGHFHFRNGGEAHLNTPEGMVALQQASRTNSRQTFKQYTEHVDKMNKSVTLRGVLRLKVDKSKPIPLSEVQEAKEIVKRFNTGAMSLGSISRETHEALAVAMNSLGARSNTGEGGEDPTRFKDNRRSAIKQVASGRFGVTSHYLANSDQIQIKMAQGAKPGEGGELPGAKVTKYIAQNRMTTQGVGLISPPPHHDIYSIEDLAQLIHDLKNAQPHGEVSVKLVSEVGVGVVAAGVAKAKADHVRTIQLLISSPYQLIVPYRSLYRVVMEARELLHGLESRERVFHGSWGSLRRSRLWSSTI